MSEEMTTSSLKAVFRFPFQGPDWQTRFLIGAALNLAGLIIPIVPGLFVYGYVLQIMRRAIEGQELTLPAWNDWGKLGMDGLRGWLVSMIYLLPALIVLIGGMALYFASSFAFPLMMSVDDSGQAAAGAMLMVFVSMGIMFLSIVVGWVLLLLGAIPLPVAIGHLVRHDKVAAAFRVREWWALLRRNKLGYFIVWVIVAGLFAMIYLFFMLAYYTVILCVVGYFLMVPLMFYIMLVGAALFGQAYRESVTMLAAGDQEA
ncbi:MAG: DUF4013 domain-containing protein [Chloroflexi bacterium]|nr:DUF4013 domain-containing protein [Chloroflexota bacterium]MBU1747503.1 DUF4013 domain-containing protein [Chloroflexota bacterium]